MLCLCPSFLSSEIMYLMQRRGAHECPRVPVSPGAQVPLGRLAPSCALDYIKDTLDLFVEDKEGGREQGRWWGER